jgi:hypothetical protein
MYRPEDLLNLHLDVLRGELTDLPVGIPDSDPELDELLAIAGLLAETLGAPEPNPAARAAARERFLSAMRHPHLTLVPPSRTTEDDERPMPGNVIPLTPRMRS